MPGEQSSKIKAGRWNFAGCRPVAHSQAAKAINVPQRLCVTLYGSADQFHASSQWSESLGISLPDYSSQGFGVEKRPGSDSE
jgi:hypothetical protein